MVRLMLEYPYVLLLLLMKALGHKDLALAWENGNRVKYKRL